MRRTITTLTVLAVAALIAQPSRGYEDPNEDLRGLRDRFLLSFGGFFPRFDTQVRLDSTNLIGSIIRLESNLDLREETSNFRLEGHWRFSPRRRIEFSAFNLERESTTTLDDALVIPPDTEFLVGARVRTEFDTRFVSASYKWSFVNNGRVDTGFSAGLSLLGAKLGLDAVGSLVDDQGNPVVVGDTEVGESFTLPVPVLGQFLELTLAKRLFYRAGLGLFIIDTSGWQGSIVDVRMSLDYYFNRTVGIGLGYNNVAIEYEEQDGSPRLDVEYRFQGAIGYLSFVF